MNRLKELRKEKKLSQKEIADFLTVNEKTISRWENGESQIKSDKAKALADYFGVSVAYLLGYSEYRNALNNAIETQKKYIQKGIDFPRANSLIAEYLGEKKIFELQEILKLSTDNPEYTEKWVALMEGLEALYSLEDESKVLIYFSFLEDKQKKAILELMEAILV
ncbi:helix-turn-helix domain-containing protein [Streptococcus acidominimus]|uniref:XRE family transcriptional regulator n=1 Tax=Streptococcus acidominimus TaxID=1326 RepID=A0A4Y9FP46_STRAI|nr:helix-turn-helix transcriptional regulator [Streptococcus acidominimus]MBF0818602.1 helix-turn-helix transcriptional regulator [Streptococcus acidominimus]MBF0838912.1 helix-turn-helix transcriptional regulator [Streptococcus acidominimus]MBF0847141.1 helix-turn-helix transcriptional regulator [Streptococcus danieliae]TFU30984.1 XRE family transcriptional regulator [Streptococcus acidominimus]